MNYSKNKTIKNRKNKNTLSFDGTPSQDNPPSPSFVLSATPYGLVAIKMFYVNVKHFCKEKPSVIRNTII